MPEHAVDGVLTALDMLPDAPADLHRRVERCLYPDGEMPKPEAPQRGAASTIAARRPADAATNAGTTEPSTASSKSNTRMYIIVGVVVAVVLLGVWYMRRRGARGAAGNTGAAADRPTAPTGTSHLATSAAAAALGAGARDGASWYTKDAPSDAGSSRSGVVPSRVLPPLQFDE